MAVLDDRFAKPDPNQTWLIAHPTAPPIESVVTARAPTVLAIGPEGGWIEREWDHRLLLWADDPMVMHLEAADEPFVMVPFNPTAERMAEYLLTVICDDLLKDTAVRAVSVRVWETENCYADAMRPLAQ